MQTIKASSLYIVIIVALVIAVICSSLIVTAFFYNQQYQKKFRNDRLQNNLASAINIFLADEESNYDQAIKLGLYENDIDSVELKSLPWGIYTIGIAKAVIQQDTLSRTFTIANVIDSSKWSSLYLIDEDRPLSVSGKTVIGGDVYLPKAGIRTAYVDNKAYEGNNKIITGHQYESGKTLPLTDVKKIESLFMQYASASQPDSGLIKRPESTNSFFSSLKPFNFGKTVGTLSGISLKGNIIITSDTTLVISRSAHLNNILIFARAIQVESGFSGTCQLFAKDSITIEPNCNFNYPSCLGVINSETKRTGSPSKISIGSKSNFNGQVFNHEKEPGKLKMIISLGKDVVVNGEVYSEGTLSIKDGVKINGRVATNRFLYSSNYTIYENYLVNTQLDSRKLSPYYLTSLILNPSAKNKKILQWLETK